MEWNWNGILLLDCNGTRTHSHLGRKRTLNHLAKLAKIIELCYEYLSVRSIWLHVLIMSRAHFRVNPHSIWLSVRLRTKWLWVRVRCSHLNFRYRTCFEQGVPWHWGKYRVWTQSEMPTWHDKNIQTEKIIHLFIESFVFCLFVYLCICLSFYAVYLFVYWHR